ncbi:YdcH family protein [Thiohalorhabdus methylotrophus]|uniref:YdcH family protein n=1 Tax=Thiohalorhabdus methylotrophus TaxID=3242694 RepID=A0ABV4TQ10_9GAMM
MATEVDHLDDELARSNGHFHNLLERHRGLDDQIDELEDGRGHVDDLELSRLKRERLYVKQQLEFMRRKLRPNGE